MDKQHGPIEIESPIFFENGTYHFQVNVIGIIHDTEFFSPNSAPKFDYWWFIDNNGNISKSMIPLWVKSAAALWTQGQIDESSFVRVMQYFFCPHNMIELPQHQTTTFFPQIPSWVKNISGWWANGQMSDDEFVKTMQYLNNTGVINICYTEVFIPSPSYNSLDGTLSGTVLITGGTAGGQFHHYADVEVDAYSSDGNSIAGKTFSDTKGHYSLQLPAGSHIIYTYPIWRQTNHITIIAGQNTIFNISYDNGVR